MWALKSLLHSAREKRATTCDEVSSKHELPPRFSLRVKHHATPREPATLRPEVFRVAHLTKQLPLVIGDVRHGDQRAVTVRGVAVQVEKLKADFGTWRSVQGFKGACCGTTKDFCYQM